MEVHIFTIKVLSIARVLLVADLYHIFMYILHVYCRLSLFLKDPFPDYFESSYHFFSVCPKYSHVRNNYLSDILQSHT